MNYTTGMCGFKYQITNSHPTVESEFKVLKDGASSLLASTALAMAALLATSTFWIEAAATFQWKKTSTFVHARVSYTLFMVFLSSFITFASLPIQNFIISFLRII